jgi:hypothetical protein
MNKLSGAGRPAWQTILIATVIGLVAITAQAMEPKEMVGQEVYLLTNLHPDEENARLYSTNYQLPGRLKVCTKVRITKLSKKKMKFELVDSPREYEYLLHKKSTPEGFAENIKKYFGPECPQAEIDGMSEVDRKGIKKARALVGMTKRGVIIAMGYPPAHVTHDLDYEEWMYWMNKWSRDAIEFNDAGIVESIRN